MSSQTFASIGDFGSGNANEASVSELVNSWNVDFIITVGDNNYPSGASSTMDDNVGQFYSDYIFPYIGEYGDGSEVNRFFPTLGNHEYFTPGAQPYFDYFSLPGNERYYDFVEGDVHFFALNTNVQEPDGITSESIQAIWLQEQLSSSNSVWNVVFLHESPYSSGVHGATLETRWPYAEWGADVVLSGHDHHYERSIVDCIPYILNGVGGGVLHSGTPSNFETVIKHNGDYGALRIEATPSVMRFEFWAVSGELLDEYEIYTEISDNRTYRCAELLSTQFTAHTDLKFIDLNHDNLSDVVYVLNENLVSQKNLGNGTFAAPYIITSELGDVELLSCTDMNGDSNVDFLIVNEQGVFYLLLGDSIGHFVQEIEVSNSEYLEDLSTDSILEVALDLNQDGNNDVLWMDVTACSLRGNLNLEGDTFGESSLLINLICEEHILIEHKDINGDELPDFIAWTTVGAYWVENIGGGLYGSTLNWIDENENYLNRIRPLILDVNNDGHLDILSTAHNSLGGEDHVFYYENNGDGQFDKLEIGTFDLDGYILQETITVANINDNQLIDVLVKGSSEILWFEFEEGGFVERDAYLVEWEAPFLVKDIDSNGLDDIVYTDLDNRNLVWLRNMDEGVLTSEILLETSFFFSLEDVFVQDLDGDSDVELLLRVLTPLGQSLQYYENHTYSNGFLGWPGDFDHNGVVNSLDLSFFLSAFGTPCPPEPEICLADLNSNNQVSIQDLAQFLSLYGTIYCD